MATSGARGHETEPAATSGAHSHETEATATSGANSHEVEAEATSHMLEVKVEDAQDPATPLQPAVCFSLKPKLTGNFWRKQRAQAKMKEEGRETFWEEREEFPKVKDEEEAICERKRRDDGNKCSH